MVVPPKHPKMIIFSRKANSCWVPPLVKPKLSLLFFLRFRWLWTCLTSWSKVPKVRHLHHDNRTSTRKETRVSRPGKWLGFAGLVAPYSRKWWWNSWWCMVESPVKLDHETPRIGVKMKKIFWNHQSTESFWQWMQIDVLNNSLFSVPPLPTILNNRISNFQVLPVGVKFTLPPFGRSILGHEQKKLPPGKLTWQWKIHHLKDVFPIENGNFPMSC